MSTAAWKQRVRGSLLLSACADALGAPFEGATVVDPAAVDVWLRAPTSALRWTDDTALTLALAEHLTAIAVFLHTPQDAAAAIRLAINLGGDTDTIAAMTGALSGARLGERGLPAAWRRRLEAAARIGTLATCLADLSTGHQPEPVPARSPRPPDSRPPRRGPQPPHLSAGYPNWTTPEPGQSQM